MSDPRALLARPGLADQALEGVVAAARYQASRRLQAVAPSAPLHAAPDSASERLDEILYGETFDALEACGDFLWGQARRDGYVGYAPAAAFGDSRGPPSHRVAALRTYAFAEPSMKARALGPFSLNALVRIEEARGDFGRAADGAWFWLGHLAPIGRFERDAAAVAERFLGAPYLWGGRTSVGLDCSGLIQQALYACGRACPRDADQQAGLGAPADPADLRRGDLVCWPGHIGVMLDGARLLHASGHAMAVVIEPLIDAVARNETIGQGAPTAYRRP